MECSICKKSFKQKKGLDYHLKTRGCDKVIAARVHKERIHAIMVEHAASCVLDKRNVLAIDVHTKRTEEEHNKKIEEECIKQTEEEHKKRQEEECARRVEEEHKKKIEEEHTKQAEEEHKKRHEEHIKQTEEEHKKRNDEECIKQAEEEHKKQIEEERSRKDEEEHRIKQEEELMSCLNIESDTTLREYTDKILNEILLYRAEIALDVLHERQQKTQYKLFEKVLKTETVRGTLTSSSDNDIVIKVKNKRPQSTITIKPTFNTINNDRFFQWREEQQVLIKEQRAEEVRRLEQQEEDEYEEFCSIYKPIRVKVK